MTDPNPAEMSEPDIPARSFPLSARAPGKCILFGEHAVVHGRPELLLAIDLYTQVTARRAERYRLNADTDPLSRNPYLARSISEHWKNGPPLEFRVSTRIPKAAGLGSSAAFSADLGAILGSANGGVDRPTLAQTAFSIEQGAQGVGSPGDTSAVVAGGVLSVNGGKGTLLWSVADAAASWKVRRVRDPNWSWLVAYSGIPRNTGATVRRVGERLAAPDGPALLEQFAQVADEGIAAVEAEDRERVGRLMRRNHELLREVGVSHPRLEELIAAVEDVCEGAKLTGAGAGGSIVALPRPGRELEAARRITRVGGVAFPVRAAASGATLVEGTAPPVTPATGP
ncbi:MAG TPA: mevalonate kinase [Thermoplasmata archaeon]|nr:mevalonate kinase [Thermoplasmata archaeon]